MHWVRTLDPINIALSTLCSTLLHPALFHSHPCSRSTPRIHSNVLSYANLEPSPASSLSLYLLLSLSISSKIPSFQNSLDHPLLLPRTTPLPLFSRSTMPGRNPPPKNRGNIDLRKRQLDMWILVQSQSTTSNPLDALVNIFRTNLLSIIYRYSHYFPRYASFRTSFQASQRFFHSHFREKFKKIPINYWEKKFHHKFTIERHFFEQPWLGIADN